MGIRDLLWKCPLCGADAGLRPAGRGAEACRACGATFRRGRGATIVAVTANGEVISKAGESWAAGLPAIEDAGPVARTARVEARSATRLRSVHYEGSFLGRFEELGAPEEGELTLTGTMLRLTTASGQKREWSLAAVTGVQPSSSTLQVKIRDEPVVSFRFPDESARYWEELLRSVLRSFYRETGRGEIVEFQPRVVAR